jgi:hypothetical protein
MINQTPSVLLTSSDEPQASSLSRRPSSARSILVTSNNKSSGGGDVYSGFKTMALGQPDISTPTSPIPSQLQSELPVFNNVEDFEMHQPIGKYQRCINVLHGLNTNPLRYLLGYGSSAIVYSALYKPTNKIVAVKIIDLDMFERNQIDELRVSVDSPTTKVKYTLTNHVMIPHY